MMPGMVNMYKAVCNLSQKSKFKIDILQMSKQRIFRLNHRKKNLMFHTAVDQIVETVITFQPH
jgi:hypothetical protein